MKTLSDLFTVTYGNKLDLNKMRRLPQSRGGVSFVGRSSQNHGVSATVAPIPDVEPFPAGTITVALGGSKLLASFVQDRPFYTAQNVAVLIPKAPLSFEQKVFVCICIRHNRFRYSAFGREANRTIRQIAIPNPSEFPGWVESVSVASIASKSGAAIHADTPSFQWDRWREFALADLFDFRKGKRLTKAHMTPGSTPFIGAIDHNNGVSCYIGQEPIHDGGTITVNYNGSVGEAFYQPVPFWASDDVNVLYPKFEMTPETALFLVTVIRQDKYRFSYGRKWHLERMAQSTIRLPSTVEGEPDWQYMSTYMKTLAFSSQLEDVSVA